MSGIKGRAETREAKRHIVARILDAWNKMPNQRLGQLLDNAVADGASTDIYNIEDERLAEVAEAFAGRVKR